MELIKTVLDPVPRSFGNIFRASSAVIRAGNKKAVSLYSG